MMQGKRGPARAWLIGAALVGSCSEAPDGNENVTVIRPASAQSSAPVRPGWITDTIKALTPRDPATADYRPVEFSVLSGFPFGEPDLPLALGEVGGPADLERQRERSSKLPPVPADIRALNGRKVSIRGFMMPLDFDRGTLSEFILNGSADMCAFGVPSSLNEWVLVRMAGAKRTRFTGHFPVSVFGTLEVREEYRDGRVVSLYRMSADFLGVPEDMVG